MTEPIDEMEATIRENEAQDPTFYRDPNAPKRAVSASSNTYFRTVEILDGKGTKFDLYPGDTLEVTNPRYVAPALRSTSSNHFLGYPLTADEQQMARPSTAGLEDWVK